ncbi:GDSL-type esterase/lipase family protein [Nocardioides aquiterrae]|uniref:Fibronectin type-III domain-containing protein n=1 Tax=Nocardioides aquiterrae TaxID=203799 RepID=A0ABP4EYW4_9ACTN
MIARALCLVLLLGGLSACSDGPDRAERPVRILLVGDSVTQGSAGDWTWRYRLWEHLRDAGVDLVGPDQTMAGPPPGPASLHYADPDFDRDHAARWGKSFVDTDWTIAQLVDVFHPDVVVELLGVNDAVWGGVPASRLLDRARDFVEQAQAADPDVDVVLGELPQTWYAAVPAYDAGLRGLADRLGTERSRVVVADAPADFRRDVDTYDPVHPSASGEVKIAAAVADALAGLGIGSPYPRPLPDVPPVPVEPAVLTARPRAGAAQLRWEAPPGGWTAYVWRRDTTRGEEWQRLPLGVPGPSWKAEGLIDGDTYEFRLQMAKGTSVSEVYSNVVTVVPAS